ncbi:MAG: cyclic peptide export ABC transporter [Candidatus Delongbacteria bacterium]|nr:cyclic peptide export ABC transporter [Candidatus Delongbacteria bacterium]
MNLTAYILISIPLLIGTYLIPYALTDFNWKTAIVWSPISFPIAIILFISILCLGFLTYFLSLIFPLNNRYKNQAPLIISLSLISGIANAVVIFIITHSIRSQIKFKYLLFYFILALFIYIVGRKVVESKLIKITLDLIYDLRLKLLDKIFTTSYQKFEKVDRGRVYATLNNDTATIGGSASVIVTLITSIITIITGFIYLSLISFWSTALTLSVITIIATLYYFISQSSVKYWNKSRDTHNVYMRLINGLIDGFKELSMQINKKLEYKSEVLNSTELFRNSENVARIKFLNGFLIGESLLIVVLGFVSFGLPNIYPDIKVYTLLSFIMILLYLIGPINGVLNSIPQFMRLRISWDRVNGFIKDIPSNIKLDKYVTSIQSSIEKISLDNVMFVYNHENEDKDKIFSVGPMNFWVEKGEVLFIIGGNGSGKTTLAKLLTGLYKPDNGNIKIDDEVIDSSNLGEYFSVVFSDYHLFEKLYNVNSKNKGNLINDYLELLKIKDKVEIKDNSFTTIDLSGGQKKRLALFRCYMEDKPIYLFDELAADQDPEFRKYFYRTLIPQMKKEGKIIIAITHDDHYFDVADKILKMDMGNVDFVKVNPHTEKLS